MAIQTFEFSLHWYGAASNWGIKHSQITWNGSYSSFSLKERLWGQSNKNLHSFCGIADMIVLIEIKSLYAEEDLITKSFSYITII